jgi:hypothetical protein
MLGGRQLAAAIGRRKPGMPPDHADEGMRPAADAADGHTAIG